jgi:hypothetical protein
VRIEISLPAISLWRGTKVEKIARLGSASKLVMSGRVLSGEEAGGELPAPREGCNKSWYMGNIGELQLLFLIILILF